MSRAAKKVPPTAGNVCERCKWFAALTVAAGECRRYPPTVVEQPSTYQHGSELGAFVLVEVDNWCGEWTKR